ncbi:DarT ssDNA thymidine ADP-ribosyltransferase family protein [Neobacillus dielmonensis]|uniref:DarT ssDNA thymidine ADP-ribosyltransferase family protein n=1 Tax=Neobacillus dielmonensis TaxID=1347369 RepID=UPI000693C3EA|nr:DarT ssDNA thymidine ADP-ribosyltransferase family protein [Neobacillus dielmonensis]
MENFIIQNGIRSLYHFTKVDNLPTILFSGLIARTDLDFNRGQYFVSDNRRLDESLDAISCTISFPQYQMLYRKRKSTPESKWVVIELSVDVLLEKECSFCHTNAASNAVRNTPLEEKQGLIGLTNMFAERSGKPSRKEMGLLPHFPTDPQAEVLVKTNIEVDYFKRVIFENESTLNEYRKQDNGKRTRRIYKSPIEFVVDPDYFGRRLDYKYWGKSYGQTTGFPSW